MRGRGRLDGGGAGKAKRADGAAYSRAAVGTLSHLTVAWQPLARAVVRYGCS